MNNNEKISVLKFMDIEEHINKNLDTSQILKKLEEKNSIKVTPCLLQKFIKENFNKEWDESKKVWITALNPKSSDTHTSTSKSSNTNKKVTNEHLYYSEWLDNSQSVNNSLNQITKYLVTLLDKITQLESDMKKFEAVFNKTSSRDNPKDNQIDSDELINLISSEKKKRSITINTEMEQKLEKLVADAYGIKNNKSKIIEIAIALALYKNNK
ncbi:hypothetical protein [Clostridium ganghwense]|uniref:Uncharacterized protein n=1 Tax=Clostridium ganghwense TaxID=312089 RepID=A0ABT4CNL8_9CLOT|nr:hypothetical protein [Clostridium ganghwense]MCY6370657.1 hypothetical protein [Clostridium ganghwense]